MKWVLIIWTIWSTGQGLPMVEVKTTETYHPTKKACELAMEDYVQSHEAYTEAGYGYVLQCEERQ